MLRGSLYNGMNILNFLFNFKKKRKRRRHRYSKLSLSASDIRKIQTEWGRVEELVKLGKPSQMRQAVIKADNILNLALFRLSSGTNTGERLKNARPYFKNYAVYQGLWDAHKVRNALVHEADYEPTRAVTKDAITKIKRGLGALGAKLR